MLDLDAVKAGVRRLWFVEPPLSAREIGAKLGVTKNAVVGHAHRMDLPKRGNPIRRRPKIAEPKVVYSQVRGEWLCQDGFSWTDDPVSAGVWDVAAAEMTAATIAQSHEPVVADLPPESSVPVRRVRQSLNIDKRGPGRTPILRTLTLLPELPRPTPIPGPSTGRGCLFPMWGNERAPKPPLFCGEPISQFGGSYCDSCRAVCYIVRKPASDLADAA